MLQAQIDIIDEAGHPEESVTIVGSGRVSLGTRATGGHLHTDEAETDLAVIVHDGTSVSIDVKQQNAHQPAMHVKLEPGAARRDYEMFIAAVRRCLEVKQVFVDGDLLQGNAIIHKMAPAASISSAMMSSPLVRRAQPLIAQGAAEVTRELREQGKIDEHGDLIVPWPGRHEAGLADRSLTPR
jgi:hypothetical protein